MRGAVAVAERLRVSPIVIGVTLVGFGTSVPELLTSVQAARAGSAGIAVGNVVGSNIANILLILGMAAAIRPIAVGGAAFRRDGTVLALATLLCLAIVLSGSLGRVSGLILLAGLAGYVAYAIRTGAAVETEPSPTLPRMPVAVVTFVGGLLITLLAARALVTGAVSIAADWGISETIIGLTIVAIGTSMPELVTSVVAARRGQADLAFGNIVGSNIFNILGILGITAAVSPLQVPSAIAGLDIWVMLAATLALVIAAITGWRISRGEGAVFVAAYAAYLGWLVLGT